MQQISLYIGSKLFPFIDFVMAHKINLQCLRTLWGRQVFQCIFLKNIFLHKSEWFDILEWKLSGLFPRWVFLSRNLCIICVKLASSPSHENPHRQCIGCSLALAPAQEMQLVSRHFPSHKCNIILQLNNSKCFSCDHTIILSNIVTLISSPLCKCNIIK